MKKTLAIVLALMMVLGTLSGVAFAANTADVWDGTVDTSWYNTTDTTFEITTAEALAGLAQLVNGGTDSFAGKTVLLAANIDLYQVDWTAIGTAAKPFLGTFDGQGNTISNLWGDTNCNGLFGYTSSGNRGDNLGSEAVIKNFKIDGAVITDNSQKHEGAGAVVGCGNMYTTIKNVNVTGEIIIVGARAGGILGYAYSGAVIDNCHVDGTDMDESRINALYWACGGIMGFAAPYDGDVSITNCSVKNVSVNAVNHYCAGGILGVGGNGKVENVTVSNVTCTVAYGVDAVFYVSGGPTATGTVYVTGATAMVNGEVVEVTGESLVNVKFPVAEINGTYYDSLEDAFRAVADGEEIDLCADVALNASISFTKDITFTLDGNGHKIYPSATSTEVNSAFNMGGGNDSTVATRKYTFKNITFSGWTTSHVLRLQGVDAEVTNCTFTNNNQTRADALGLLTLTFCDAEVTNCTFTDNVCAKAIDINSWGDDSVKTTTVENCAFDNNICTGNAVVLVSDGLATTVKNSEFTNNKVVSNINGATLYLGFNYGIKSIGNYFAGNTVEISSTATDAARPYRSAGAIFAGFADDNCAIENNVFVNNTLKLDDADAVVKAVAYSAYYGAGDISKNYWNNGTEPVAGADFTHEYETRNTLKVDSYYTAYSTNANGNLVFTDSKDIVDEIAVAFVKASEAEGELVYNINLTADGKIINRLNSVDLQFELTQVDGTNDFEIIASNKEVVINPVENSKYRYEFHYDGKTGVETDTAATITIGQVKLTGYGKFIFAVDTDATTNVAHATKNDNNIVDTFIPNGNGANGNLDITKATTGAVIINIPVRDLTINIAFPNAVKNNAAAYQDMTVTIVGGETDIIRNLGADVDEDAAYTITEKLPYNTAYTVTVTGAGYRTARYTVTLNDHKTLNFWNNVMDEEKEVEVGKDSSKTTKNFLAGDIVKDNNINIYDLSAVVSYFASTSTIDNGYAKYDLNRDGVIDSKDVAYVLVSWNN